MAGRTFIATNAGYRLEVHPPREWLDELLEASDVLQLTELQLLADDPEAKAAVLAELLDSARRAASRSASVVHPVGGPQLRELCQRSIPGRARRPDASRSCHGRTLQGRRDLRYASTAGAS